MTHIHSAIQKLEKLQEQERVTRQLIETVRSTIIDHVLAVRAAHIHLPSGVVDILNSSVNDADRLFSQDTLLPRRMECWRKRVAACAEKYTHLASHPLRRTMENRLPQELCDMVYDMVACALQR